MHILTVIYDAGQSIVVGVLLVIRQSGIIPMLLQIWLTSAEYSSHMNKAMRDLSESKVENNTIFGCGPQGPQHAVSWTSSTDDSNSAPLWTYTQTSVPQGFPVVSEGCVFWAIRILPFSQFRSLPLIFIIGLWHFFQEEISPGCIATCLYQSETVPAIVRKTKSHNYEGWYHNKFLVSKHNHNGLVIFSLVSFRHSLLQAQSLTTPFNSHPLPMPQETWVWSLRPEDFLEKETATHSSIPAWEISWTEGYNTWGCKRVGHNLTTKQQFLCLSWQSSLTPKKLSALPLFSSKLFDLHKWNWAILVLRK